MLRHFIIVNLLFIIMFKALLIIIIVKIIYLINQLAFNLREDIDEYRIDLNVLGLRGMLFF